MIYLYVALLRLVSYLDGLPKIISFLGVTILIINSIFLRTKRSLFKITKLLFLVFTFTAIIIFHSSLLGRIDIRDIATIITYLLWLIFCLTYFKNKTICQSLHYIFLTFFIYVLVNYMFYKISFADQKLGINSILELFGVFEYRIFLPLSSNANVFASLLSSLSVLSLFLLKKTKYKLTYLTIYIFIVYVLIMVDSRLMLVYSILFSIIYWFSLNKILVFIKHYWYLLVIVLILFFIIFYNSDLLNNFKRSGEKSGKYFSRIEIWRRVLDVIFGDIRIMTGFGINSLETNLSEETLNSFQNQNLQTSHNFIIQTLFDFGIIGLSIIVIIITKLYKQLLKIKNKIIYILFTMVIAFGASESIPTFYSFEISLLFISLISLIISKSERIYN